MKLAADALDRRLMSALEQVHVFPKSPPHVIGYTLRFENRLDLTFHSDSVGEGIVLGKDVPARADLEEYGLIDLRDASNKEPFSTVIGRPLALVNAVVSYESNKPIGLVLHFRPSGQLAIVNWGDEIQISQDLSGLSRQERLAEVPLANA